MQIPRLHIQTFLKNNLICYITIGLITTLLGGCGGSNDDPPQNSTNGTVTQSGGTLISPELIVTKYLKINEVSLGGNIFDDIYKITVSNSGRTVKNVALTFLTSGRGMSMIDGAVIVEEISAGSSVTPVDTITIRQDRSLPFDEKSITVTLSNSTLPLQPTPPISGLPPDPELAGNATVGGIDANTNGVRDDVERAIILKYGTETSEGRTLLQIAKGLQVSSAANTESLALQADTLRRAAANCAFDRYGDDKGFSIIGEVSLLQLNTLERFLQESEMLNLLSGRSVSSDSVPTLSTCQ